MQISIDTNEMDSPQSLRCMALFLKSLANTVDHLDDDTKPAKNLEAGTTINGVGSDKLPKLTPDFEPKDSMPRDALETGRKDAPSPAPLPPNISLDTAGVVAIGGSTAPTLPLPPGPQPPAEFDTAGVAWDINLHSSTRSRTIEGKWKARRNRGGAVGESDAAAVPAGTVMRHDGSPWPTPHAVAPTLPTPPTGATSAPVPLPPNNSMDGGELPAGSDARLTTSPGMDFATLVTKVTAAMGAGTLTQAGIVAVLGKHGLDSIFSLNLLPDRVAAVATDFGF